MVPLADNYISLLFIMATFSIFDIVTSSFEARNYIDYCILYLLYSRFHHHNICNLIELT